MADAEGNVPGGYFMGRPSNAPEQQAAAEPSNTQAPGGYFIGTPQNLRGTAERPAQPIGGGELKRSKSFLEWFPCLRGGQVAN